MQFLTSAPNFKGSSDPSDLAFPNPYTGDPQRCHTRLSTVGDRAVPVAA